MRLKCFHVYWDRCVIKEGMACRKKVFLMAVMISMRQVR